MKKASEYIQEVGAHTTPQSTATLNSSFRKPTEALPPRAWMLELMKRFSKIYGFKFTDGLSTDSDVEAWIETWSRALSGFSGNDIARGLHHAATTCNGRNGEDWPPSSGQFRAWCMRRINPAHKLLPRGLPKMPTEEEREHAKQALRSLKQLL